MKTKKPNYTEYPPLRSPQRFDETGKFVSQRKEASSMSNARSTYSTPLDLARSAMQKALRRSDIKTAMWFAHELVEFGFRAYAFRVCQIVAAEDCADPMTSVRVHALVENAKHASNNFHKTKEQWLNLFLAKLVIEIARAPKGWESHHLAMWVEKTRKQVIRGEIEPPAVPEYAADCHTAVGRTRGAKLSDFWREYEALSPLADGDDFADIHGDDEAL